MIDVGVDLGRGDIGMTEHFLNDPQIGTVSKEMRGETVPEQVGVGIETGELGPVMHDLPDPLDGQFATVFIQE